MNATTITDPPPRTPTETLQWAATRVRAHLVISPDTAGQTVAAWLDVWARDLETTPATAPPEPLDLDAIERLASNSHDPVMGHQARALVTRARQAKASIDAERERAREREAELTAALAELTEALAGLTAALAEDRDREYREPPYHFGEMETRP